MDPDTEPLVEETDTTRRPRLRLRLVAWLAFMAMVLPVFGMALGGAMFTVWSVVLVVGAVAVVLTASSGHPER